MNIRLLIVLFVAVSFDVNALTGRIRHNLNGDWRFFRGEPIGTPAEQAYDDSSWEEVMLPHSHRLFSANVLEFANHGREHGWYRRHIAVSKEWLHEKVFIEFQGAMQTTKVWLNGSLVGEYAVSGYDSFHFDLTPYLKEGDNVLAVLVDNRPNPKIPPDGVQMDFLLFGGLYRDVFLHVTDPLHITFPWEDQTAGVRITYPELSAGNAKMQIETAVRNDSDQGQDCVLVTELRGKDGKVVRSIETSKAIGAGKTAAIVQQFSVSNPRLWSPDDPYLYTVTSRLRSGKRECGNIQTRTGMRWVRFDKQEGFFLNGKPLKLIGVNRHQSWPYIGYAVPNNLHRFDAQQIKEMGANWVRLCHYPHDPDFLDALDELGLMALAEAPTWNSVGGEHVWMANVVRSFRSMIRRDRNHASLIVWNVCINHHGAHPALVEAAKQEDPSRYRGQDNVPTPMNFKHRKVSGRGALAIEHTGHTYPAPRGADQGSSSRRAFHSELQLAQRHWEHIDAVLGKADHAGSAAWAMHDYNTLYNVYEPGIAWHGFADLFRIPKLSYYWHQSEFGKAKAVHICPPNEEDIIVFSNADRVKLWIDEGAGYRLITETTPSPTQRIEGVEAPFSLRHPPYKFPKLGNPKAIRAEGMWKNGDALTNEWKRPGAAVKLNMTADLTSLGSGEITRVVVTLSDNAGTKIADSSGDVLFTLHGAGEILGENPAKIRAGKAVVLFRANGKTGASTLAAAHSGLASSSVSLKTGGKAIQ